MAEKARAIVVTIDGPAGVGKSTVAAKLANRLRFVHLNSGALFRAVAREALNRGVDLSDDTAVSELAWTLSFRFSVDGAGQTHFTVDGAEIEPELLGERIGEAASRIAVLPKLRERLLEVQRRVARDQSIVVEGRDAGTVVFPNAPLKFFLDASLEVRAKRRMGQSSLSSCDAGSEGDLEQIRVEIEQRDVRDSTREIAPQVPAADAVLVDTSGLEIDGVVDKLYSLVRSVRKVEQ